MSKTNGRGGPSPTASQSAPASRPTKRTPKRAKAVCDALEKGASYKVAAAYGDMAVSTLMDWKASDPEFLDQVEKARAKAVMERVKRIEQAAKNGSWQADAWWLERAEKEEWGRHERIEHTGADGGPIRVVEKEYVTTKNGSQNGRKEILERLNRG